MCSTHSCKEDKEPFLKMENAPTFVSSRGKGRCRSLFTLSSRLSSDILNLKFREASPNVLWRPLLYISADELEKTDKSYRSVQKRILCDLSLENL